MTGDTPVDDSPPPTAISGVTGPIHQTSRAEHLQQRRDQDRARWLGTPVFRRPCTPIEQALITPLCGPRSPSQVQTQVDCRGGAWRRSWPELAHGSRLDSFEEAQP